MLELVAQRATGEVLLGCPMDYPSELDDAPTLEGLLATARAIAEDFPGLRDAPIDRVWAGLLPYTPDTLPIIDEVAARAVHRLRPRVRQRGRTDDGRAAVAADPRADSRRST